MRVLVVEDYAPVRDALAQGLREAGYAVDATGDGEEGLWFAVNHDYDVIVLDLMLPGLDGLSILRQVRAVGRLARVLVLTAKDGVNDRVRGLDLGADDYLVKPFAFAELLARVRSLTRRAYALDAPGISVGALRIDTSRQRVFRGDDEILLTPREYALLEYLARRSGEVVPRTDIWEHLYAFTSEADSNVVDVYVGYLRRKLEGPNRLPLIHTVRGRGYQLSAGV